MDGSDLIDRLAGIAPGSDLAALRAERADIARHTEGAYEALLCPRDPGPISAAERATVARDVALHHESAALAAHYGALLGARGGEPAGPRWAAIAAHVAMASRRPRQGTRDAIGRLRDAGLDEAGIVTVSQLVAFVSYQVRLLVGLALLGSRASDVPPPELLEPGSDARPVRSGPSAASGGQPDGRALPASPFTTEPVDWAPWIEPVDLASASPAQRASLSETPSNMTVSAYSLVLAHDPAALSERTPLFNKVMYGPRGLPRAERELATLVESVENGCVYCASVHARRFIELAKRPDVVARLYAGEDPGLEPRRAAIAAFARDLSPTPPRTGMEDAAPLRAAGLTGLEILDAIHAVAMFAWANRLMLTLGEPVPAPGTRADPDGLQAAGSPA